MLRREVTQRLQLRSAPELRFVYDDGMDNTTRVEQLLAEIDAERKPR
jgi:ribosome-binding factor A